MKRLLCLAILAGFVSGLAGEPANSPYSKWKHGPSTSPSFFPIAVWLQSPRNAARYREAGINTYVGLWKGPTEEQLTALKQAGMRVICDQNSVGLKHLDDPTIIGWMHGDEPDNAQSLGSGKGYGPPILPERIIENYSKLATADPSRPVLLNLGQGVAWDRYYGRGVRTNHPEDYPEYIKGCDIVSFDIYPVVHDRSEVAGNLWYVPQGVERLTKWGEGKKVVWNCLECTHISNPKHKATPRQVRSEAWMSLIQGSRGLIYFVHEFQPSFREAALLEDAELLPAITALNKQITALAPVLNAPSALDLAKVETKVPVSVSARKHEGAVYVFAAAMREQGTTAKFHVSGVPEKAIVQVIDENRSIPVRVGEWEDEFEGYGVHLYKIAGP